MAEIWSTAEKVANLVLKEAESLNKVKNEVESVKRKLRSMGSELKKADTMINRDEKFDKWASELRDLAFKAEDVVEVFVNNETPYDVEEDLCTTFLQLITGFFRQISTLHKLKNEIKYINGELSKLEVPSKQSPQIQKGSRDDGETSSLDRRGKDWASFEIDEDDIVGFQKEEEEVTSWLTREEPRGRPVVFSIRAPPGAGKSTLAFKIYKSSFIKSQFDCVAWVSVSQEYHVKDIWQAILKEVGQLTSKEETEGILREKVKVFLKERNYLIILDDVWKPEDLNIIQLHFPKSPKKKCRVLVTTRNEEVARVGGPKQRLNLRQLNPEESMDLFLKRVYPYSPEEIPSVPQEMKYLAGEMLSEWCEGLPIAIVLLGGILSSKDKDPMVWRNIRDKVHSDLVNEDGLRKVIALSYNQLPYELRSCFLYFGLFPEDSLINCDRLIRLWVAEGFLEQGDHNEANKEDVARACLIRLIERSMIQVVERKSNEDPLTCRTHDLLRDLAMKEGKIAKFLSISMEKHVGSSSSSLSMESSSRRVALHGTSSSIVPIQSKALRKRVPRPRAVDQEGSEDDIVGFQEEVDDLARTLTKEVPLGQLAVVSMVADAGFGKTALARKVYNRNDVKPHFGNYRAWVYISANGFEVKHVLRTILQQITRRLTDAEKELKEEEEEELQRMVHNLLEGKNYLIVFDNLLQTKYWDAIKMVFPNEPLMNKDQKCRVLVTTRDKEVAHYVDPSSSPSCLKLGPLNEELSLKLFLKTVFKCSSPDEIPEAILGNELMIEMARKMVVEFCDRLPSLILALGSFLSSEEKDTFTWVNMWAYLYFMENKDIKFLGWTDFRACITKVFSLCYVHLPDYLASCIRYFYSLPLDSEILCDVLMRLWVEQGCLESREGNYATEDFAKDCLEELIQRKLIAVVEWRSTGDPQTCRMPHCFHSLMVHNMERLECKRVNRVSLRCRGFKNNYCWGLVQAGDSTCPEESEVDCGTSSTSTTTTTTSAPPQHYYSQQPKRSSKGTFSLSHLLSKILADDPFKFPNHVYSLLCFSKNPNLSALKEFHLLRVVDLQGAENILELPIEIKNLTLLRYLGLRGTGVKVIPPSIANLRNLETLDAPTSKIPIHIVSLHQLRHLFAHSFHSPPPPPVDHMCCDSSSSSSSCKNINIAVLEHLRTLELLGDRHKGDLVIDGLDKLTNLRVLRICVENCDGVSMSGAIANLTGLKFLRLTSSHKTMDSWSWLSFSRHSDLNEMILPSFTVPMPKDLPRHLTFLWLDVKGRDEVNLLSTLEKLLHLKKLCLVVSTYSVWELEFCWESWETPFAAMTCSNEGFKELEYFYIRITCDDFRWDVEAGALRSLRVLHIEGDHNLSYLPHGLRHVTNLKELIITRCYAVKRNILNRQGLEWEEVKGIGASVKFSDYTTVNPPP